MSQENLEMVRCAYVALNQGDWDRLFRDMHPEVELTTQRGINAGTKRGREGVQGFLEDYLFAFEEVAWEPTEFFESRGQVVVLATIRGRPRGSSADIVTRNGHVWTIRNGKTLSMKTFPNPDEALEAAGLSRPR